MKRTFQIIAIFLSVLFLDYQPGIAQSSREDGKQKSINQFSTGGEGFASKLNTVIISGTGFRAPSLILPIELQVTYVNGAVQLKWEVKGEQGIRSYVIERSANGKHFTPIWEVAAWNEAEKIMTYKETDLLKEIQGMQLYYRIKQYTFNDTFSYSPDVRITLSGRK